MARTYSAPESLDSGNRVNAPGTYHCLVTKVEENPVSKTGNMQVGVGVEMQILAGTDTNQKGKTFSCTLFDGSPTHSDGGEFANKVQGRLFRALNLLKDSDLGKEVTFEVEDGVGQQIVVTLEHDAKNAKYMRIAGDQIFHVDDNDAATCPKDLALLAKIPKACRIVHAKDDAKKPTSTAKATKEAAAKAVAATASISDDIEDV